MLKIDDLDLRIIRSLREDARQSFRDLAEKLGVAEGTIYNRVNKLKEEDILKRFLVDIDYSKLGYDLAAVIGIISKGGHLSELEKDLAKEKSITAVYDVTGEYDAVVIAKFKDRSELNSLVKRMNSMEYIERTYTMVVLNVVKEAHGIDL